MHGWPNWKKKTYKIKSANDKQLDGHTWMAWVKWSVKKRCLQSLHLFGELFVEDNDEILYFTYVTRYFVKIKVFVQS